MEFSSQGTHMSSHMWNLKYDTTELIYETEIDPQTLRTDLWLPRAGGHRGIIGSLGLAQTLIWRTDKQQGPTAQHRGRYSTFCNKP